MNQLNQYLLPWLASNLVFLLALLAVYKRPIIGRMLLAMIFLGAAYYNTNTAILDPQTYLEFGDLSWSENYQNFINGWFSEHIQLVLFFIATGQVLIFLGLLLRKGWTVLACLGGFIFGLAIAPLGFGSAFPSSLIMGIAFLILLLKYKKHDFIWKFRQYRKKSTV